MDMSVCARRRALSYPMDMDMGIVNTANRGLDPPLWRKYQQQQMQTLVKVKKENKKKRQMNIRANRVHDKWIRLLFLLFLLSLCSAFDDTSFFAVLFTAQVHPLCLFYLSGCESLSRIEFILQ